MNTLAAHDVGVHELLVALADSRTRPACARRLAAALGCEEVALFLVDPALAVMVPAPAMPKTYAGGALWRAFLERCDQPGRHEGRVDLPAGSMRAATALCSRECALVLLGGTPSEAQLDVLRAELPLLAALLCAEQALALRSAEALEAREAASRAHTLVRALDTARATAAELNLQLRQEHERKDEFLAMLAHELRNPLSPLVNSVEILRRLAIGKDAAGDRQLQLMTRQLTQLSRLVDDLLDVSRVSRGKIALRRETLRLSEVVSAAVESVKPGIEAKGHRLQVQGLEAPVYVNGDRVRLTQVFANLLQNAVKYTDPGGFLNVGLVPDGGRVSVVIRDSGVGIPAEMLSRVFDLFTQVPVALDRAQGGLGIGLTLVRTLLSLHGGHVTAHSVGLGHGSTFTASLPLVAAPLAAVPAQGGLSNSELAKERANGARVLVVDDNRDAADSLAEILGCMGAEVRIARDAAEALALDGAWRPELVLMDIGLPGMDGYEAGRRLRRALGPELLLVAMTGYGTDQDRRRSAEAGFDAHLVKPVPPQRLEEILVGLAGTNSPAPQAKSNNLAAGVGR